MRRRLIAWIALYIWTVVNRLVPDRGWSKHVLYVALAVLVMQTMEYGLTTPKDPS